MRNKSVTAILPDQDSDELQFAYKRFAELVEGFNARCQCQITCVQFDVIGGVFGGLQRDYRGCYVCRDRVDGVAGL